MSQERLDAAARAGIAEWDRVEPKNRVTASFVASHVDSIRAALTAGDAVMFSDEAIERAAEVVDEFTHDLFDRCAGKDAKQLVRDVIEALKGGTE